MSCQALKTGLELSIQLPVFDSNEKQLECINEPVFARDITTVLTCPSGLSLLQSRNPTCSQKEQPISMIGHGHPSQQGLYVVDSSFHRATDADNQKSFMEHDHLTHLKRFTSDNSLNDGQICQRPGCSEAVEGRTVYCKIHGGQRCQMLGCPNTVPEGSDLCMSHGGGRPRSEVGSSTVTCTKSELCIKHEGDGGCKVMDLMVNSGNALGGTGLYVFHGEVALCKYQGCSKRAQGSTMYCKVHGGSSKGCVVQGCTKGAHGGTPLCIGHGGGKRCTVPGCPNAACGSSQGRTDCCVRHGGGKRCRFDGCGKGAQGNTDFCIAHGGGRRCKFEGCGKSAQGRTDFCIRHGGGRRCKFQGCNTSAKWGMDFCSMHRKSLSSGSDASHEMLPVSLQKRRAKKAKSSVEPHAFSGETVTTAAIAGSSMHKLGIIHMVTAGSGYDNTPEGVARKHALMAAQLPVPPAKSSPPSGMAATADSGAAARNRALLGL